MVSFWPRHIYRNTMKILNILATAMTMAALVGCASRALPPVDPTLPPDQIVRSLNGRKMITAGDPDIMFGWTTIKAFMQPASVRCQSDGGQLEGLNHGLVRFPARDFDKSGLAHTHVQLPTKFVCRLNSAASWGIDIRYANTEFFTSTPGGGRYFLAEIQLGFIPSTAPRQPQADAASNLEAVRKRTEECSALRQAYTERLQASPAVGMSVVYGTIIDLRPPLALIQYDELGRQMKGREQEWVQISTLPAGSDCPR